MRTLTKWLEKKLDKNDSRILCAVTDPGNSSSMATYLPSQKPSKCDDQDILGTAGDVKLISDVL